MSQAQDMDQTTQLKRFAVEEVIASILIRLDISGVAIENRLSHVRGSRGVVLVNDDLGLLGKGNAFIGGGAIFGGPARINHMNDLVVFFRPSSFITWIHVSSNCTASRFLSSSISIITMSSHRPAMRMVQLAMEPRAMLTPMRWSCFSRR